MISKNRIINLEAGPMLSQLPCLHYGSRALGDLSRRAELNCQRLWTNFILICASSERCWIQ